MLFIGLNVEKFEIYLKAKNSILLLARVSWKHEDTSTPGEILDQKEWFIESYILIRYLIILIQKCRLFPPDSTIGYTADCCSSLRLQKVQGDTI